MRAWRAGNVAIANAPGAGVADDKVVYAWVPGVHPLLPRRGAAAAQRSHVPMLLRRGAGIRLDNAAELVLKPANESGGYGLTIGSAAPPSKSTRRSRRSAADPRNWVAQPILQLSTAPTLCAGELVPRHVDLRPFVLSGARRRYVTMGGLTRVALVEGSLVVNSSQGGGSKDTWIVEDPDAAVACRRAVVLGGA